MTCRLPERKEQLNVSLVGFFCECPKYLSLFRKSFCDLNLTGVGNVTPKLLNTKVGVFNLTFHSNYIQIRRLSVNFICD